jgi:hypothetical protein
MIGAPPATAVIRQPLEQTCSGNIASTVARMSRPRYQALSFFAWSTSTRCRRRSSCRPADTSSRPRARHAGAQIRRREGSRRCPSVFPLPFQIRIRPERHQHARRRRCAPPAARSRRRRHRSTPPSEQQRCPHVLERRNCRRSPPLRARNRSTTRSQVIPRTRTPRVEIDERCAAGVAVIFHECIDQRDATVDALALR